MYSQANVREESVLRPPSVAVRGKTAHGWKGVRPRVRLENRMVMSR